MTHDTPEIIDATVVEVGSDLATRPAPPASLFHTDNPVEVIDRASEVANALARVIGQQRMFTAIRGKNHVTIEGWQTLGSMLGVTAVVVSTRELADGDWEARAEARTLDGRVVGAADAMCCKAEGGNWGPKATSNARRAMAQTRAMSRALRGPLGFVVTLAGYATTAAEEMPADKPAARIDAVRAQRIVTAVTAAVKDGLIEQDSLAREFQQRGITRAGSLKAACATMTDQQANDIEQWLGALRNTVAA